MAMIFSPLFASVSCSKPQFHRADIQSESAGDRILAVRAAGEAGDRKAIPLIVDRLDDEDDGVRFFAILALERLTGTRMGFDYAAPEVERSEAVNRWREYVRNGGHLEDKRRNGASDQSPVAKGGLEGAAAPR